MRRRPGRCTSCGATWTQRNARYCGWCGARLEAVAPAPPRQVLRRLRAPRRLTLALAAAAAGAGLVGAVALTDLVLPDHNVDPDVELPATTAVPAQPRLSPEEAAALRRQVDPNRLRCEPRGCEVWRRAHTSQHGIAVVDDLLVLMEADRVVGLDVTTGRERWSEPVDAATPAGRWLLVTAVDDGVAVELPGGELTLFEPDGRRRWTTPLLSDAGPGAFWHVITHDGFAALQGTDGGSPVLVVVDLTDGRVAWRRDGVELYDAVAGRALVTAGGAVELVDLTTGAVVWRNEGGATGEQSDVWLAGDVAIVSRHHDAHIEVVAVDDGTPLWDAGFDTSRWPSVATNWLALPEEDGGTAVVDLLTGGRLVTFDDRAVSDWTEVGDDSLLLLAPAGVPPADGEGRSLLLALDTDGGIRWEREVPWTRQCCTWLEPAGVDAVAVRAEDDATGMRTVVRVDAVSGEELPPLPDDAPGFQDWRREDGTHVVWGQNAVTVRNGDRMVRVRPGSAWPQVEDPWVFGNGTELLGVRLVPDP